MDIILIIFFMFVIYGAKFKHNGTYDDYLSKDSTIPLRGIFSVLVIFHHISQRTSSGYIFNTLSYLGFLNVSVFFVLSGYGLLYQLNCKGDSYLDDFISKRFPSILIPYINVNILYYILRNSLNIRTKVKDLLLGLINGTPIVSFSWYVIALCYFYLSFYLSCKLFKKYTYILISVFFCTCFYCIFCYSCNYESWWYNSIFSFLFGLILYVYRTTTKFKRININFYITMFTVLILFICCFSACHLINQRLIRLCFQEVSSCLFPLSILLICKKVKINNKCLTYLGTRSYEIYLAQEIPILILRSDKLLFINNDIIYSFLIIVVSLICAEVLYRFDSWLIKKWKYLFTKINYISPIKTTRSNIS
ncbi:MAG: acyltransferase [Clostridium sp.]|nr:acyltransferase [Clostridium sp.]